LQNGNTLITEAAFGRIVEITEERQICWEYVNPGFADYKGLDAKEIEDYFGYPANALFRAYKYTPKQLPWLLPNSVAQFYSRLGFQNAEFIFTLLPHSRTLDLFV